MRIILSSNPYRDKGLRTALEEMEDTAQELEESIDEAQESGPDQNLSLFRRRLEPMA